MMSRQRYTEGTNVNEVKNQQEEEEETALRSEWSSSHEQHPNKTENYTLNV